LALTLIKKSLSPPKEEIRRGKIGITKKKEIKSKIKGILKLKRWNKLKRKRKLINRRVNSKIRRNGYVEYYRRPLRYEIKY
jgi:hypothetical protein